MTPLEEAVGLQRDWGRPAAVHRRPEVGRQLVDWLDDWLQPHRGVLQPRQPDREVPRAPRGTMAMPQLAARLRRISARSSAKSVDRRMVDHDPRRRPRHLVPRQVRRHRQVRHARRALPDVGSTARPNTAGIPWIGAHLGGNPENLARLQALLDRYPDL